MEEGYLRQHCSLKLKCLHLGLGSQMRDPASPSIAGFRRNSSDACFGSASTTAASGPAKSVRPVSQSTSSGSGWQ